MNNRNEFERQDDVGGNPSGVLKMNAKETADMDNPDVQAAIDRLSKFYKMDSTPHKVEKRTAKDGKEYWCFVAVSGDEPADAPADEKSDAPAAKPKKTKKKTASLPEKVEDEADSDTDSTD